RPSRDDHTDRDEYYQIAATVRSGHGLRRCCADTLRRDVIGPCQDQCDWKSDQQEHDYGAEYPVWQFPRRENSGADLNDESRDNDVSGGNAIDLSPLHFFEEAAHKCRLKFRNLTQQSPKTFSSLACVGPGFGTQIDDEESSLATLGCIIGSLRDTSADPVGL